MSLKEKIEKYYDIKFEKETLFGLGICLKGTDRSLTVHPFRDVIFTYGEDIDRAQLNELIDQGTVDKVSGMTLYEMFTDLTIEDMYIKFKNYDIRTKNYFDAILRNIGYVKCHDGRESIADMEGCTHMGGLETRPTLLKYRDTEIDLYKVDEYYVVEKFEVYPPDDYGYLQVYFKKKPRLSDFKSWEEVTRAERLLLSRGYKFTCWECGNKVHWLDGSGSLEDKVDNLTECYCGC